MEVGVLNLQIHDNSAKAAEGLGRLATALERVKKACDFKSSLGTLAKQIERMDAAVQKGIPSSAIKQLNELADVLKRIKETGNVSLKFDGVKNAVGNIAGKPSGAVEDGFREVESRIQETNEQIQTAKQRTREISNEANETIKKYNQNIYKQFEQQVEAAREAIASAPKNFVRDPVLDIEVNKKGFQKVWETYKDTSMAEQIKWQFADLFKTMNENASATTSEFTEVRDAIQGVAEATDEASTNFEYANGEMQETRQETEETVSLMDRFREALEGAAEGSDTLRDRLGSLFPRLTQLAKQFERIAMRRSLTWVLKQITAGVKEGVENFKAYSEEIGTAFAPAMDNLASSLQVMRNSIGAALAPMIQALIPVVQSLVNSFVDLVNWVNQFFALLGGKSTWSKAIPAVSNSMDKVASSAGNAKKEIKGLLADWDELNIIQSETNGGVGGGGASKQAEEYEKMFTEMNEFAPAIKELVNQINEKFGSIWGLVGRIGTAILAWKVSGAFAGIVGSLAALVGAGVAMDLVFKVTEIFDDMYFNTGDEAWLIGSLLTPLIGSVFARQILKNVAGGAVGEIAIPLMFIISAAADIKANVEKTDVSALDPSSLLVDLITALKGGAAAGYLAYTLFGHSWGAALKGGAVGLLATFGIAIGLKADSQLFLGELTKENIKAKFISIASMSAAGAGLGLIVGKSAAAAVGVGMLFGGLPIITAGISIGLAAINQVVSAQMITKDVIQRNLIAGGLIGAGLAITSGAVGGATVAMITGPAGAAITVLALFAIEAIIANAPKTITWGDYKATEEAIKSFVRQKVFTTNPNVEMELLEKNVAVSDEAIKDLKISMEEVTLTVNKIKLGFQEDEVLKSLHEQVFGAEGEANGGLIGKFKAAAAAQQNTIKTAATLMFTPGQNEDGTVKKLLDEDSEMWKTLTDGMDLIGQQLAKHLEDAYKAEIGSATRSMELETVAELTDMLTSIAAAMTSGEAIAKAQTALMANLGNLSKESFEDLAKYINDYKEEIAKIKEAEYDAILAGKGGRTAAARAEMEAMFKLFERGDITEEQYNLYVDAYNQTKADYEAFLAGRDAAVKEFAKAGMDEEIIHLIREAMIPNIQPGIEGMEKLMDTVVPNKEILKMLFNPDNTRTEGASELLQNYIEESLKVAFGDNYSAIKEGIDAGIFKYSDFFSQELVEVMANRLGMNDDLEYEFKSMIAEMFGWEMPVREIEEEAEDAADEFKTTYDELNEKFQEIDLAKKLNEWLFGTSPDDLFNVGAETKNKAENGAEKAGEDLFSSVMTSFIDGIGAASDATKKYVTEPLGEAYEAFEAYFKEHTFGEFLQGIWQTGIVDTWNAMWADDGWIAKSLENVADWTEGAADTIGDLLTNLLFSTAESEGAVEDNLGPQIWTLSEDVQKELDDTKTVIEGTTFPAVKEIDVSAAVSSVDNMTNQVVDDVNTSIAALNLLSGYVMGSANEYAQYPISHYGGAGGNRYITQRASGGFIRSGDLVMANENGMIEMMGTMGNKPVVANNQQIVEGIQKGVASANAGQNELLRTQNELLRKILEKTGTMKLSPTASWGEFQQKSAELWAKQTGR